MNPGPPSHRAKLLRIGLTGPIGCGKSTVARWLGAWPGVVVVDADRVAREVLYAGEPALDAVVARFGRGLLRADGSLDRAALGRIAFADTAAMHDLEAIIHPAVRPRILAAIADAEVAGARAVVIEAIKLVESGLADACDEVWLVTCDPVVQRARLLGRGSTEQDADQRIAAQGDLVGRVGGLATRAIDTSGSQEQTMQLVMAAFEQALDHSRF